MQASEPQANPPQDDGPELSLIDLVVALGEEKLTLFLVPFAACLLAIYLSFTATPIYTARTMLMPMQQGGGGGAAGALAGLSGMAGMAGLSGLAGMAKSSDEMYIAMMRSQSVQDSLIEKFKLKERYGSRNIEEARLSLGNAVSLSVQKGSGMLVIEASDEDPQFAARLANQQVAELAILLGRLSVTEAQQRRAYYEQQVKKTQATLLEADARMRSAQEKAGMASTAMLAEARVRGGVDLRGQIIAREIQIQAMTRFATAENPDVKRALGEVAALRSQLAKFEQASGGKAGASPQQDQEAAQAFRDLKMQEAMLEGFLRQFELARIDESKEGPPIQVVDVALPPEIRSQPQRRKMVTAWGVTGLIVGVVAALLKAYLRRLKSSPEGKGQLKAIQRSWSLR